MDTLGFAAVDSMVDWASHLLPRVLDVAIFGVLGIVLLLAGFKVFDVMTPKLNFQAELGEKKNLPLALVIAAFLLAIAIITYAAMHG